MMNPVAFLRNSLHSAITGSVPSRQYSASQILLLARTYADLLMRVRSKAALSVAFVGHEQRIFAQAEALSDCMGMGPSELYFAGKPGDAFHPSADLSTIDLHSVDVAIVADADETRERQIKDMIRQMAGKNRSPESTRFLRLLRLADAHMCTATRCRSRCFNSCLNIHKLAVISLATYLAPRSGAIIECGTYLGGTTIWIALFQQILGLQRPIFACDTYEGMPAPVEQDGQTVYQGGLFSDNKFELVERFYREQGVLKDIQMVKGLVQHTLPGLWSGVDKVAFALLDTDQYAGTKAGLGEIIPRLSKNGLIIVDDASVEGVDLAIREAMIIFSNLRRIPLRRNFDVLYLESGSDFLSDLCMEPGQNHLAAVGDSSAFGR